MADKRIIELANEKLVLADGDMTIVDSESGTYKYDLNRLAKKTITDSTLSVEGKPADAKAVGDALASVDVDTVNNARQLLSENYVLDQEPYLFRASGGDGADRVEECIVGGSVAWNQLIDPNFFDDSRSHQGVTFTKNSDGSITVNGTVTGYSSAYIQISSNSNISQGHKYYVYSGSATGDVKIWYNGPGGIGPTVCSIGTITTIANGFFLMINNEGTQVDETVKPVVIDLTTLFGSTIADHIYALEQATAGAGVSWFRKYFPADFYEYSAPTLRHVEGVSQKEVVGWNQWDEDYALGFWNVIGSFLVNTDGYMSNKTHIKVLPNTEYCFTCTRTNGVSFYLAFYDADKNFISRKTCAYIAADRVFTTPNNCHFVCFSTFSNYGTTYKNDICISLSDPTKNGVYEPYKKNIYPLDSTLTLRGIPKLDANNSLYYDGDTYESDGTVTRRYGTRAYQSGDESLTDAITDGTNTVYKLTTPTTETADPYTYLQTLDPYSTEEYVTTSIVPVGHESHYLENLRAKIEGLPKDFSTLIAPTEATYKATRNYTSGSLLIVDNILYKATANIANGATITPNTNVTATTLAAVIAALA